MQQGVLPAAEVAAGSGRTSAPALVASHHDDTDISDILNSTINKNIIEEVQKLMNDFGFFCVEMSLL